MNESPQIPRVLIVDDVFGRTLQDGINQERRALCGQYLLEDVTEDEHGRGAPQTIRKPVSQVVFCRGQLPACASVGEVVENDLEGVLRLVRKGWAAQAVEFPSWSLVLLDLCFYTGRVTWDSDLTSRGMPEGRIDDDDPNHYFGLQILQALHQQFPDLPVIILSSKPREAVSLQFSTKGALGFIDRSAPHSPRILREYLWRHGLIQDSSGEIIGTSKDLLMALRGARRAASGRRNVLLRGERGAGKELFAAYIHRHTDPEKAGAPYVVVDSGTLNAQLFTATLFGYKRGAFTGAERDREGLILQASGGDLFLDEIGNMQAEVQAGVLRVLEDRTVTAIGANQGTTVDVRFLSATNEDIEGKASAGAFRADLLDRLRQGGTLWLPPLRNRPRDIPLLAQKFAADAEASLPGALTRQIEGATLDLLVSHDWPGNVRELRDCIFKAVMSHPDVEFMVPAHIEIPAHDGAKRPPAGPGIRSESSANTGAPSIDEIGRLLDEFDFAALDAAQLSGRLPILQRSYARLLARYLRAALELTRRRTLENPSGDIMIHPALKLMTGDRGLSASRASDIIKRLLRMDPEAAESLLSSSALQEAQRTALRLRPSAKKKG